LVQIIGTLLPLLAVFALVFGPITGWMALERQRQPIVWLMFGALLGPLAIGLLLLAPPGACPRCNETVSGWPSACIQCGENLVAPLAAWIGRIAGPVEDEPSGTPIPEPIPIPIRPDVRIAAPQAAVGRRAPVAAAVSRGAPESLDSTSTQPEPGWATRLATLARAPAPETGEGPGRTTPTGIRTMHIGNGTSAPDGGSPRFSFQTFLPPPGPLDPPTEDPTIVAVGVYVGGTERLTIAGRYAIGYAHGRLKVLGPYETNPRKLSIDWDLTGIDIGQGEGQLVLARIDGRRTRVLTFRLLSTFNRAMLDAAIVVASQNA
jgi:hypothetical protein